MKKVRIVLAAVGVLAIAGSAMALKAKPFQQFDLLRWNGSAYVPAINYTSQNVGLTTAAPYTLYKVSGSSTIVYTPLGGTVHTTTNAQ